MSDKAAGAAPTAWNVPAIDAAGEQDLLTAGGLETLQQQAYDEAWQAGHAEGLAAGEQAARERAERFDTLLQALSRPFDELDEMVEKQLVELAMAVARQLFRREIRQDPTHVIGVVREAIQVLPAASRKVQVHLHPDDAALVRESLTPAEHEPAWTLVEDPLTSRGGCTVTTENSQVDATAEARLRAIVAAIAGDERQ